MANTDEISKIVNALLKETNPINYTILFEFDNDVVHNILSILNSNIERNDCDYIVSSNKDKMVVALYKKRNN